MTTKWQVKKIGLKGRGGVGEGCLLIRTKRWRRTGESRDFFVTCCSCACWFTSRLNPPPFCSYCHYLWLHFAYLFSVLISRLSLSNSYQIWTQCGYGVASVTSLPCQINKLGGINSDVVEGNVMESKTSHILVSQATPFTEREDGLGHTQLTSCHQGTVWLADIRYMWHSCYSTTMDEDCVSHWSQQHSALVTTQWLQYGHTLLCEGCDLQDYPISMVWSQEFLHTVCCYCKFRN